jgi:RNA-directed DNA polymerase
MKKKQMTALVLQPSAGASSTYTDWKAIDWPIVIVQVRRLQLRIAKAFREGKHNKVKALQWILTHSFCGKLLAVKRVTQNRGGKTPGIDGIVWKKPKEKMTAALSLKRKGYKTKPLKRIYIAKKQKGKFRPLSIPVIGCRAQQALHLLALEPVSEMLADKHSYGFRPLRSIHDAIDQCFKTLARKTSAHYILEGDIKNCFCAISQSWLLEHAPMDKVMLQKWLTSGYLEEDRFYTTESGVAQGGVISPTLLCVTLRGLEAAVQQAAPSRKDKVHTCVYADDFVITGATREVLENRVKPAVVAFLKERGLSLSEEKTKITHIEEGFNFLGMNLRKYKGKMIIKPAKSSVKRFLADIREIIKNHKTAKTEVVIRILNPKIRGWSNQYKHVCSKETFGYLDSKIFRALWSWAKRRHPNKSVKWIKNKYFRSEETRNWTFSTKTKNKQGKLVYLDLILASDTPIKRHIKLRGEATPYNPIYHEYLNKWIAERRASQKKTKRPKWWLSWWNLLSPKDKGAKDWAIL